MDAITQYLQLTGFANVTLGNIIMIAIGCAFIYLAIAKEYEPLLLLPIGFGILVGNIPIPGGEGALTVGIYEEGSVLSRL